jgi:hypothetical protein
MNSNDASNVIDQIRTLLDPRAVYDRIDRQLSLALASFQATVDSVDSNESFLQAVARFIAHMYSIGIQPAQQLSDWQARSEAVHLLERYYANDLSAGYAAALLDALQYPENGINIVFRRLASALIALERAKYGALAMAGNIDPADWCGKVAMTRALIDEGDLGDVLSTYGNGVVFEVAANVETLLANAIRSDGQIEAVIQRHMHPRK